MPTQPEPGPHRPVAATPPVPRGAARRTTTIDVTRPDGVAGRVVVHLDGRDVVVGPDGSERVAEEVALTAVVEPTGTLVELSGADGLEALTGVSARGGFTARVWDALAGEVDRRGLASSMLEDLPGAFLVGGFAPLAAGAMALDPDSARERAVAQADICAGWATGQPLHTVLHEEGRYAQPMGPPAPRIEDEHPGSWHELRELPPGSVRRRRLVEAGRTEGEAGIAAWTHFRDTHRGEPEMVMHEYVVAARISDDERIAGVEVDVRVLPWEACPGAAASGTRIVGVTLAELPRFVRADLVGTSTCTHLNTTLRSLADVRALARLLPSA